MSSEPLISVCTPVYNGQDFLEDCIKGVLAQRYRNIEYIIVDNASTDKTAEIIKRFSSSDSRIKTFRNASTVPVIDNFKTCIRYCSADARWVKYALADDYLHPNCLDEMLAVGESDDNIGLVSAYRLYGSRLTNTGLPVDQSVFNGGDILKRQLLRKLHVCSGSPNTVLYRKSAYDSVAGFDNQYLHADTELAMRLLDKYDLGFAHCVYTRTGLHSARQETRSIYNGLVIQEYLDFGFRRLPEYQSVEFNEEDLDGLSLFYAQQVNEFLAKKMAHLDIKNIKTMLANCPSGVKDRLLSLFIRNSGKNIKTMVAEFRSLLRGKN